MSSVDPGYRRLKVPVMPAARQQPVFIDLTQDDSDDDMDMREAPPPSHHPAVTNGDVDGQGLVSEADQIEENQYLPYDELDDVYPYFLGSAYLHEEEEEEWGEEQEQDGWEEEQEQEQEQEQEVTPCPEQRKSPTPEEPPLAPFQNPSTEETQVSRTADEGGAFGGSDGMFGAAAAASNSGKDLDASRDIELRDIHDLRLRHLTKDVYKIVSKNKPNITIRACRDALTSGTGWHVAKAVDSLIGFSNDDTGNSSLSKGSIPSKPAAESSSQSLFVALPDDHQQDSYNDSDVPWEVVHSFLTIQRVDFDSGRDFLRACEKLRQKVLITWNLRFTQIFTHTLFINAMRSYNPFLANVLRRTQLAGELEFQDLKRIIRKREMTDDTIIGSKTWAEWKAELLSTSGAYKGKEPEIY